MTDPVAAAKLFSDLDQHDDPNGAKALKKVDFRTAGFFFPEKDFSSVKEAQQALETNKKRIQSMMEKARYSQIDSFTKSVCNVIQHDNAVSNMPSIRINATKSMNSAGVKQQMQENQRNRIKSVPARKYITHSIENGNTIDPTAQSGVFEPASAHHKFNKEACSIRTMYRSMFNENKAMNPKTEYHVPHVPKPNFTVSNGCERISNDGHEPKYSLTRNAPGNI
jgi:hypothetical protein